MIYHTREDVKKGAADWGLATFDKLVNNGSLQGDVEGDYNISRDMLRILVILDREGVFDQ